MSMHSLLEEKGVCLVIALLVLRFIYSYCLPKKLSFSPSIIYDDNQYTYLYYYGTCIFFYKGNSNKLVKVFLMVVLVF